MKREKQYWKDLIHRTYILGLVKRDGTIVSHLANYDGNVETHSSVFSAYVAENASLRWVWDWDKSIHTHIGCNLSPEDRTLFYDMVREHLTKKHGITFWNNGHHDIDRIQELAK